MKNPAEVRPPAGDCLFIALRVEMSRDRTSFALFDEVPLDLSHSTAIGN